MILVLRELEPEMPKDTVSDEKTHDQDAQYRGAGKQNRRPDRQGKNDLTYKKSENNVQTAPVTAATEGPR